MEKFNELEQLVEQAKVEAQKFYEKNNKAAGTRLRLKMLDIRNLSQEIRKDVSAIKNGEK